MSGVIIAGDRSGSGKTTVTMALLSTLRSRGTSVQAFKVGPDYIDPMFHRAITGRPAYNLDPVLTSETYVQHCFQQHSVATDYAMVEGVMGLFDGAGGTDWGSTAHVARLLNCPVILVVDCARLSRSLAAIVHGYQTLDDRIHIAGVVLNRVGSDRHLAMLKAAIAPLQVPVLGVLRRDDAVTLPDRHLGLVPTDELSDLPERFRHLATLGQRCFDWQALEKIWQPATDSPTTTIVETSQSHHPQRSSTRKIRIGIARDRAFNFYYADNLEILTRLGAELVPFSPLTDDALPPDLSGLWLGGGFPEMFAAELSHNLPMRAAIAQQVAASLPTYAECGGLMYLCESLIDFEGHAWPMLGAIPTTTTMTGKLTLGYRQVTVQQTSPLVVPGQQFWGHEFHRSVIAPLPVEPLCTLSAYPLLDATALLVGTEGWGSASIHASYVHLHWGAQPALPKRFIKRCDRDHS
ncbi:MAG: cobyrinate a,c-diamide synthase [Cyanobacteria bacterium P01_D01_bin.115]